MSAQIFAPSNAKLVFRISLRSWIVGFLGIKPRIQAQGTYSVCLSVCLSRCRNTDSCIM